MIPVRVCTCVRMCMLASLWLRVVLVHACVSVCVFVRACAPKKIFYIYDVIVHGKSLFLLKSSANLKKALLITTSAAAADTPAILNFRLGRAETQNGGDATRKHPSLMGWRGRHQCVCVRVCVCVCLRA